MQPDAGDAQQPPPSTYDGPVFLIGTVDGAGDRLADLLGRHPRLCRVPRTRLLVDLAVAVERNQPALAMYGLPEGGAGRIVAANRRTGAGLPPGTYLEVPEAEMLTDAAACVLRVLRFLGQAGLEPAPALVGGPDGGVADEPEVLVDLVDRRLPHTKRR